MSKPSPAPGSPIVIRPDWLARRVEEIVDPEMPIIDAHQHLWDHPGERYLFDEALADVQSGHNIRATVHVECNSMYRATGPESLRPVGETEYAVGAAARSESGNYGTSRLCAAIVGAIDCSRGEAVEPVLHAHIQAGGGRFRGIRIRAAFDADPFIHRSSTPAGMLMQPATMQAIACIGRLGLTLDLWTFHTQLFEVFEACQAFPETIIIINHVGGPLGVGSFLGKRSDIFSGWAKEMRALSSLPNALVKIGGLGTRFTGFEFHNEELPPSSDDLARAWGPYADTCIQAFGPARCMFEADFPVDKGMCSYHVLWNAYKKMAKAYAKSDREALLFGTANRVYSMNIQP